jgi:hypothetical protein
MKRTQLLNSLLFFKSHVFAISLFLTSDLSSQNLPYSCNFDSSNDQAGWTYYQEGVDGSSSWNMSGAGYSAPNGLSHDYNVGAASNDVLIDWMVSPALITDGPFEVSLMVRQTGFSTPTNDNCEIYIIVGDPDPTSGGAVLFGNLSAPLPSASWVPMSFVNTNLVGEFRIAFRYKTIGPAWSTYAIDDIAVELQSSNLTSENALMNPDVIVYPNPFCDLIRMRGLEGFDQPNFTITDAAGKLVDPSSISGQYDGSVDLSQLNSGIYFLKIQDKKARVSIKRIMKM